jgi:hypothetical protein
MSHNIIGFQVKSDSSISENWSKPMVEDLEYLVSTLKNSLEDYKKQKKLAMQALEPPV